MNGKKNVTGLDLGKCFNSLVKDCQFGVSPVNYLDSDSELSGEPTSWPRMLQVPGLIPSPGGEKFYVKMGTSKCYLHR